MEDIKPYSTPARSPVYCSEPFLEGVRFLNIDHYFKFFNEYAANAGPPDTDPETQKACNRIIEGLEKFDHHDEAYALLDLTKMEITWEHGIKKWFGYSVELPLPMMYFAELVHPFISDWYCAFALGTFEYLLTPPVSPVYLQTRSVINMPLKTKDKGFMAVKQMAMPFEFDKGDEEGKNKKVSSLIFSYTLMDNYEGQPLKSRVYKGNTGLVDEEMKIMKDIALRLNFSIKPNLSGRHFKVIDAIEELLAKNEKISIQNITSTRNSSSKGKIAGASCERFEKEAREIIRDLLKLRKTDRFIIEKEEERDLYTCCLPRDVRRYELLDFLARSDIRKLLKLADAPIP